MQDEIIQYGMRSKVYDMVQYKVQYKVANKYSAYNSVI